MKYIKVRPVARPEHPNQDLVILDDQNDAHPGGYVQIKLSDKATDAGDTDRVQELIANGTLILVPEKAPKEPA
jgi:hypothetical protein